MEKKHIPVTEEQVERLNRIQNDHTFHGYTCGGNRTDIYHLDGEGRLIATVNGWVCPFCDYTQEIESIPPSLVDNKQPNILRDKFFFEPSLRTAGTFINDDISLIRGFISSDVATNYFNNILNSVNWSDKVLASNDEYIDLPRKMAYVSDLGEDYMYKYANLQLKGTGWNDSLIEIRDMLNKRMIEGYFNSVLLNLYEDGKDEIKWHSDKEEQLGLRPMIATINLGAKRTFSFVHKELGYKIQVPLMNGDLLVMHHMCQENFKHAILPEKSVIEPRISLTYRRVKQ